MITCVVTYTIDPAKTREFEAFARAWMDLVGRHGGVHHGYFLPSEGASDEALALFSFPLLLQLDRSALRTSARVLELSLQVGQVRDISPVHGAFPLLLTLGKAQQADQAFCFFHVVSLNPQ